MNFPAGSRRSFAKSIATGQSSSHSWYERVLHPLRSVKPAHRDIFSQLAEILQALSDKAARFESDHDDLSTSLGENLKWAKGIPRSEFCPPFELRTRVLPSPWDYTTDDLEESFRPTRQMLSDMQPYVDRLSPPFGDSIDYLQERRNESDATTDASQDLQDSIHGPLPPAAAIWRAKYLLSLALGQHFLDDSTKLACESS